MNVAELTGLSPAQLEHCQFMASVPKSDVDAYFAALRKGRNGGEYDRDDLKAFLGRKRRTRTKNNHVSISEVSADDICVSGQIPIHKLKPSLENDQLYRPINPKDTEFLALVRSVREHGILEPLVSTLDGWIISGHRRYAAARKNRLCVVPVRVEDFRREDDQERFMLLLREHNRQREKTLDEKLKEELVTVDPSEAYEALIDHRNKESRVKVKPFAIIGEKHRPQFSKGKKPFVDAIIQIVQKYRQFWPLSDRQVHYYLLDVMPLRFATKPHSRYANDKDSYKDTCGVLTRARLFGLIPWEAIADVTRPVTVWDVHQNPRGFMRDQLNEFLKNYWRDLMQSQPNHVEIVGEKNTLVGIIKPIAMKYTIPFTLGRGYSSLDPRHAMAMRYKASGKKNLVLLGVSDFDPDGEEIGHSFAKSMRDDFGISHIHPIKVALTYEQVQHYKLPPMMKASDKQSSRKKRFIEAYGDDVWESEAMPPQELQAILTQTIDSVIDIDLFNHELDQEKKDAAFLDGVRKQFMNLASHVGKFGDQS